MKIFFSTLALLFVFINTMAEGPPQVFIDKGACPQECCTYRVWDVKKQTDLYEKIDGKSKIGTLNKDTKAQVVTGEVHAKPLKLKDKKGEEFFLLTYEGDGSWKIWKDGKLGSAFEGDWVMKSQPDSTWWIQVQHPNGQLGWTQQTNHFEDYNGCDTDEEIENQPIEQAQVQIPADGMTCDFRATGIEDRAQFVNFFHQLKKAASDKDISQIEKMVLFPLRVNGGKPSPLIIKSLSDLQKLRDVVFKQKILDLISAQKISDLFCRDTGVMFGDGAVWVTSKNGKLGIYSINVGQ